MWNHTEKHGVVPRFDETTGSDERTYLNRLVMMGGILVLLLSEPRGHAIAEDSPMAVSAAAAFSDCLQGELPPIFFPGSSGWGVDNVPIGDGEVQTYCFTLNFSTHRLRMAIVDVTGGNQCTGNATEYIPPPGSGLETQIGYGMGSAANFFDLTELPRGTWRIRITEADTPGCDDRLRVVVRR